jgi:hypothetical protein
MPPKKAINTNELKENNDIKLKSTNKSEVLVEDVESDDESIEESDQDSETDSDEENNETQDKISNDNKKDTPKEAKEKLKKLTFDEIYAEIDSCKKEESIIDSEIKLIKENIDSLEKKKNGFRKNREKLTSLLPKAYVDGCNKARKEKKKRTNSSKSGILNEMKVPPILINFLEIPETSLLRRPQVFHLLNEKFKQLGLKKGQETIFDKKTAKIFSLPEGHIIQFQKHQTFLAKLYSDAGIKSEKVVETEVIL